MGFGDIPRERIPWHPSIDYDKCTSCQECYNFCKNEVFVWDEASNRPVVENLHNCVLGCSACVNLCSGEAISFMSLAELRETIRRLRAQAS